MLSWFKRFHFNTFVCEQLWALFFMAGGSSVLLYHRPICKRHSLFRFYCFIDPLVQEFGWSYTQVSFAASLRGLEMGVFAPLAGFLVDRFGSRRLILYGVICVGFGLILLSYTNLLSCFMAHPCSSVSRGRMCYRCYNGGRGQLVQEEYRKGFRSPLGRFRGERPSDPAHCLAHRSRSLENNTNPTWSRHVGYWHSFILIIRDKPETYGYLPDGGVARISDVPSENRIQNPILLREALKNKSFLFLNIAEFTRMMLVAGVVTHAMPYLGSMGVSRTIAGLVVAGIPLTSIIGRLGFGWLADRYEKRRIMFLSFLMMGWAC